MKLITSALAISTSVYGIYMLVLIHDYAIQPANVVLLVGLVALVAFAGYCHNEAYEGR